MYIKNVYVLLISISINIDSFVNVLSTSRNDVVSASYIDVETTSKTRYVWKLDRRQLSTFLPTSSNDAVFTPHIDVETTLETRCI